jgi:hydroxymethylbilane synthase
MESNIIRIGTRGSALALYQAKQIQLAINKHDPEKQTEIVIIHTKGDKILDVSLSKIGDKGLFTKELEIALLNHEIDMAVHSLKDVPTSFPEGLHLGAVLKRTEVRDALVSKNGKLLHQLSIHDVIATSSLRRRAQLLAYNSNFNIIDIRGNINTRLEKMDKGYCDAIIMAATALQRLGLEDRITEILDSEIMIPAVGQGVIAIETRINDSQIASVVKSINHEETMQVVIAERAFLKSMDGGCQIPLGCYSVIQGETFSFTGFVADLKGVRSIRLTLTSELNNVENIAIEVSQQMKAKGAMEILEEIRNRENFM